MLIYTLPKWVKTTLVFLIGLSVSWGTFHYVNVAQLKRNALTSQAAHQNVEKKLHEELQKISLAISSLHILFVETDSVERSTFHTFTAPFLRNLPGVKALEWMPKIAQEERARHEQQIRQEGFEKYQIRAIDTTQQQLIPAPTATYYYPIQYIVPEKWNAITLGVDLSTSPLRKGPILLSEQRDSCIVSKPLRLIQNQSFERSFLILQSVKKQEVVTGVIQGVYNTNYFIDTILKEQLPYLEIKIYDTTNEPLSAYDSEASDSLAVFAAKELEDWAGPIDLVFGNRRWQVYTRPRAYLTTYPHRPIAYALFAMGLMVMAIIQLILNFNDRYANQLQKEVSNSTQQLSDANLEQATLLKEIHHRVKNNLQVITGLLSLQASGIEDEETKELFRVCQYRIAAMGMLHEQLYQSENLSRLSYGLYLEKLIPQLLSSIKGKQHRIEVDLQVAPNLYLNMDTAIPLGLLINELFTNSLKYAFPDSQKGRIYLQLQQRAEGDYLLLMGDDGVGFLEAAAPHKSSSLGLLLVRQLVRQLNGQWQQLVQTPGTHYRILFEESEGGN
jgi:two-component sensor histidine kinase